MKKIILVGYMGSGKSVVGQLLAQKKDFSYIDLDKTIEESENSTIKSIFETKGEIYFRKLEHQIFKELTSSNQQFVLSTGGGTICYANNHLLLKNENVISIYLYASIETLSERLKTEKKQRPLIADLTDDDLKEFVAKHLFERSFFYNQCQFKIDVNQKLVIDIVNEIIAILA